VHIIGSRSKCDKAEGGGRAEGQSVDLGVSVRLRLKSDIATYPHQVHRHKHNEADNKHKWDCLDDVPPALAHTHNAQRERGG
jgi:hypothetical protein